MIKGSFELMKQLNISVVLRAIMSHGSLSRADISKITGLTPASITNITKELMDKGYLIQSRIGESSGGRPPIILKLNPKARYIIGVSIGVGKIEVVITNIMAEIVIKKAVDLEGKQKDKDSVITILINLINNVIDDSNIPKEKIIGVGVAMHGVVNAYTGIAEYSPYYNWNKVDIRKEIENNINYPVFVDNDVRAMALGESWFGVSKGIENFIMINVSNGIGAGIIINNKPYYGVNFSAGEIGHIVVESDGTECNCGNYGCLETVASNNNILNRFRKYIKQGRKTSILNENSDLILDNLSIEDVCNAANNGDELAIEVIKEAARYIGIGLSNLINIFNPSDIVVVGEIFKDNTYVIETLKEIVKKKALKISAEDVRIIKSSLGNDAATIGAATLVIQEVFKGEKLIFS